MQEQPRELHPNQPHGGEHSRPPFPPIKGEEERGNQEQHDSRRRAEDFARNAIAISAARQAESKGLPSQATETETHDRLDRPYSHSHDHNDRKGSAILSREYPHYRDSLPDAPPRSRPGSREVKEQPDDRSLSPRHRNRRDYQEYPQFYRQRSRTPSGGEAYRDGDETRGYSRPNSRTPTSIEHHQENRPHRPNSQGHPDMPAVLPPLNEAFHFRGQASPESQPGGAFRTASPSSGGSLPPPHRYPLPAPLQPPTNPRSPTYPTEMHQQPPHNDMAYRQPQPPPPGSWPAQPYYPYNGAPPSHYGPPPMGYGMPPNGYGPQAMMAPQQQAPRQRTSIACRYCRKRKIRCSGFQLGGKCTNCQRMGMDCIFQPVSSANGAAFVPVSALPNGVPEGTQLFGAFGQPLQGAVPHHQAQQPPPQSGPAPPGSHPLPPPQPGAYGQPPPPGYYQSYAQPLPSPTSGQYGSQPHQAYDNREAGQGSERRLPPPDPSNPGDARRRLSASSSAPNSPTQFYPTPQGPVHSPGGSTGPIPSPMSRGSGPPSFDGSTPPPHVGRSSAAPSSGSSAPPAPTSQQSGGNIMSLANLVDRSSESTSDIDRSMLGKLNGGKVTRR